MNIQQINGVSFQGYNSILKTEFRQNKLKSIKYGFYGDRLTQENVSLEHLKPHSQGGPTLLNNLVLTSKRNNSFRGNKDIREVANKENIYKYLLQFVGIDTGRFNGDKYIKLIVKTLRSLGIKLEN